MAITLEEVVNRLLPEEPDYAQAAQELGGEALPHLQEIVQTDANPGLAAKATYLAARIERDKQAHTLDALTVLKSAADRPEAAVRVAAAAGLRTLSEVRLPQGDPAGAGTGVAPASPSAAPIDPAARRASEEVLSQLLGDPDVGVRRQALKAVNAVGAGPNLITPLQSLADNDESEPVRTEAAKILKKEATP